LLDPPAPFLQTIRIGAAGIQAVVLCLVNRRLPSIAELVASDGISPAQSQLA